MRIAVTFFGLAAVVGIGYGIHAHSAASSPTAATIIAANAAPSSDATSMPPAIAPPVRAFVRVPDLAHKTADVAEYLLSIQGLGHTLIGPDVHILDPNQMRVCATLPHAGSRVRTGTRVGLVVRSLGCGGP